MKRSTKKQSEKKFVKKASTKKKHKVVKRKKTLDYEKLKTRFSESVSKVNVLTAKYATLEKERKRIYAERSRLKKLITKASTKKEKNLIRSRINKTTRFLNSIKKRKKTFKPLKGFKDQVEVIDNRTIVRNIYKWEASDLVDQILNQGAIKKFEIGGYEYKRKQASLILMAIDDLETEADFRGVYYMVFLIELGKKKLTVTIGE